MLVSFCLYTLFLNWLTASASASINIQMGDKNKNKVVSSFTFLINQFLSLFFKIFFIGIIQRFKCSNRKYIQLFELKSRNIFLIYLDLVTNMAHRTCGMSNKKHFFRRSRRNKRVSTKHVYLFPLCIFCHHFDNSTWVSHFHVKSPSFFFVKDILPNHNISTTYRTTFCSLSYH